MSWGRGGALVLVGGLTCGVLEAGSLQGVTGQTVTEARPGQVSLVTQARNVWPPWPAGAAGHRPTLACDNYTL